MIWSSDRLQEGADGVDDPQGVGMLGPELLPCGDLTRISPTAISLNTAIVLLFKYLARVVKFKVLF